MENQEDLIGRDVSPEECSIIWLFLAAVIHQDDTFESNSQSQTHIMKGLLNDFLVSKLYVDKFPVNYTNQEKSNIR